MDATSNIATDLFYKIRSRFTGLKLGESTGQITINPESARFFDFDYTEGDKNIGHVSISIAEPNSMKVYFSNGITEGMDSDQKTGWYGFLRELRMFAKRRLLAFDTRDIAKDNLDKRDYAFLSQHSTPQSDNDTITKPVGEGLMNESNLYGTKTQSFQKLMDTRLIIKHSKKLADDFEQKPGDRSRNISALFVENQDGERFKYPFIHLAGARAMQRHVANGGLPYDTIGESLIRMSEEIAQLKSFTNYCVRNDLMNSDTNNIVERSKSQLDGLRERIARLAKQAHYENYVAEFQAPEAMEVPDDVMEEYKEKFTVRNFKEDLTSVFPVLYRLMKEEENVGYDDIVGMTGIENESRDDEEPMSSCCDAPLLNYNDGLGICSDCKEHAGPHQDEAYAEKDPMSEFENWVNALGEESPLTMADDEEKADMVKRLNGLLNTEFQAGVDGTNAITSLEGIIEDPKLEQDIKKAEPEQDVRPMVKAWVEENAPDVLGELDFGDMVDEPAAGADAVEPQQEEGITDKFKKDPSLGMNKYGLAAIKKDGMFFSIKDKKITGGPFDSIDELRKHQEELMNKDSDDDDYGDNLGKGSSFQGFKGKDPEADDLMKFGANANESISEGGNAWDMAVTGGIEIIQDCDNEEECIKRLEAEITGSNEPDEAYADMVLKDYIDLIKKDGFDKVRRNIDARDVMGEPVDLEGQENEAVVGGDAKPEDPDSVFARLMSDISEIQNGAMDDNDMADDITDELGDYLRNGDAPKGSHYEKAIGIVMDAIHDGPQAQADAAEEAISFLHGAEEEARGNNEGNEFSKKVQDLKSQGAKKGTKFKTSDGEEHTLEGVAKFIHSFYDRDSGTFPKGPEGICTMVGKKFGEQAEQAARKMVERMAPAQEQGAEELEELERIKQLSNW